LLGVAASGGELPVPSAQGRHTVEVIEAAYRSSRTGEAVKLPL
jgi:predicted dehydrogenase